MNRQAWREYLEWQKERMAFWAGAGKAAYAGPCVTPLVHPAPDGPVLAASFKLVPGAVNYVVGDQSIKNRPGTQIILRGTPAWCDAMDLFQESLRERVRALQKQVDDLTSRAEDTAGEHIYNGPVKDGASIPDEIHERFHKSIGDVLAGKVMPKAREQMRDALNRPVPDAPTTASKSRPMPGKAVAFGTQKIGIFVR